MAKAKPATPASYLAALPEPRRKELKALHAAIRKAAPGLKPYLTYSGTTIGYGEYHYTYATGREGDCPIVALSSRAQYISLYVLGWTKAGSLVEAARSRLGKVKAGKACITFKRLADLDLPVAMGLVRKASGLLDQDGSNFQL